MDRLFWWPTGFICKREATVVSGLSEIEGMRNNINVKTHLFKIFLIFVFIWLFICYSFVCSLAERNSFGNNAEQLFSICTLPSADLDMLIVLKNTAKVFLFLNFTFSDGGLLIVWSNTRWFYCYLIFLYIFPLFGMLHFLMVW